jgi:hypothetical protein
MRKRCSSLKSDLSIELLLCIGLLLCSISGFSQGGCSCPPVNSCSACNGGLTSLTLHYTGGGIPLTVTAVDGTGQTVPGGINLLTNVITVSSHTPTEPFRNGSVTVTVLALLGTLGSQTITTSCAVPIFEGSSFGVFTVISGNSLNGGSLCCTPAIQDAVAPTFSDPCPSNIQLFTAQGNCTASTSWDPPDAVDNCGPVTVSPLIPSHNYLGTTFPLGITTVTYVATDQYNNQSTCSFTVEVIDNIDPVISGCPVNADVALNAGCSYTVPNFLTGVTATDECDANVLIAQSPAAGTILTGVGSTHTITLTATDDSGNTDICSFVITLKDQTNPVISTCPANMDVAVGASCSYAVANFTGLVTATDNCDTSVAITQSPAVGTVLTGVGTTQTVTLTATDNVGNINSCSFVITLKDQTNPVISTCPANMDVAVGASCSYAVADFTGLVTATDNCDTSVAITQTPAVGTVLTGVGTTQTVTLTATDNVGNINSCTFVITLKDQTNPVISTCPANMDVVVGASGSYAVTDFTGLVTATDNCDTSVAITQTPAVGTVLTGVGTTQTVTLTATDNVGNINSCTFVITLKDQTNPVISTCPANMDVAVGASCSYAVTDFTGLVTATDNCDTNVAITQSPAVGTVLTGSTHTITLTATDDSGNTDICSFVITLKDQTNPVISTCPANMDVAVGASCSYAVADFTGLVTATDNCDTSVAITQSPAVGTVLTGVGTTQTVTLTATDNVGNINSCSFVITLKDQTNPVISTCPANMDVAVGASCSYAVADFTGLVTATDNCDTSVAITQTPAVGTVLTGVGTTQTVTLTATDNVGNINSCTFVITLKDQTNPVISTCPANMDVAVGASCSYAVTDFTGLVTATDNCDTSVAITQSPAVGTILTGVGTTQTVTLTATDNVGNINSCSFVITLKDQTNPVISTCPANMDVAVGASCSYAVANFTGLVTATDNCDTNVAITQSPAVGTVLTGVGTTQTVTLTATDNVGNINSCTFVITLKDQTNPVISTCPANMDVAVGASCSYAVADFTGLVTATDNCDTNVAITQSPAVGTVLTGVGTTQTVTLTATDNVGNINSCTFVITLKDQTNPVISTCPANMDVAVGAACSYAVTDFTGLVTATDNCDTSVAITQTPAVGTVLTGVGTTQTVTLTATDNVGNINSCSFVITLKDQTNPVISSCPANMDVAVGASCSYAVANFTGLVTATDNCDTNVAITQSPTIGTILTGVGTTQTVTLTATDNVGNINSCSFVITLKDQTNPVISTCPANMDVAVGASCSYAVADFTGLVTATDNCDTNVAITQSPSVGTILTGVGTTQTVTLTATDNVGNINSCTFVITLKDQTNPVISTCPANMDVAVGASCSYAVADFTGLVTATDNCDTSVAITQSPAVGTILTGVGTTQTVTLTATDNVGNINSCTFVITLKDQTNPVISGCSDIVADADPQLACGALVTWNAPTITDNCTANVAVDHASGSLFPVGETIVTYTATDPSGNSGSCSLKLPSLIAALQ